MSYKSYEVDLLIDGKPLRKIKWDNKTWLEVYKNKTFSIRIRNNTIRRIAAVISVDGLNVIDASKGSHDGQAYIINGYCTEEIKGWRKNLSEIAEFTVSSDNESYSNKLGRGKDNLGVIGVVIYAEKYEWMPLGTQFINTTTPTPWVNPHPYKYSGPYNQETIIRHEGPSGSSLRSSNPRGLTGQSMGCNYAEPTQNVGVGYGETKQDSVTYTDFQRDLSSKQVIVLYYDDREGLLNKGVPLDKKNTPNPFPAEPSKYFCPEPY